MNITNIAGKILSQRVKAAKAWESNAEDVQRKELDRMVTASRNTIWGREHGYESIMGYNDYRARVDVTPYEQLRPMVMRMINGEKSVLWPGRVLRYAQSSGTSDGKSKYIPVSDEGLRRCHYRGATDVVAHYLSQYPSSKMFSGKGFILGGSFANELSSLPENVKVGDLSAHLIDCINPLAELVRTPHKSVALMADWHKKLPLLVREASRKNVTNISGVPSWFLTVLKEVMKNAGADEIHQVWPNLEVFFHGGISFAPYREQYNAIIDPQRMRYMETYNASEGFFALQDRPDSHAMLLEMDAGVFYEFIPADAPDTEPIPVWEVEKGRTYAMVITTCSGLWRYPLGDTVRIADTSPVRITIAGRTKCFINAFGEEVMVHNTDAALAAACARCHAAVKDYTAAPVYASQGNKGRHEWLIEFTAEPDNIEQFATVLDRELCSVNSDYQAKRGGDIFLERLSVVKAKPGLFDRWLSISGKLGGQRKVPRLANDRHLIEPMLKLNNE